jgi:hypothetical protein
VIGGSILESAMGTEPAAELKKGDSIGYSEDRIIERLCGSSISLLPRDHTVVKQSYSRVLLYSRAWDRGRLPHPLGYRLEASL